jgi:hypothetical protein
VALILFIYAISNASEAALKSERSPVLHPAQKR